MGHYKKIQTCTHKTTGDTNTIRAFPLVTLSDDNGLLEV